MQENVENTKWYFRYQDNKSNKFWSIEVQKNEMIIVFGKVGTAGRLNVREFEDEATSKKEADKLIREKTKKGYVEVLEDGIGKFGVAEFWSLIERAKSKAENVDEQAEILTEILSDRSEEDIVEFGKIFQNLYASSYQSPLWAAAYIINGGCSDDGFDYFRGWLIAQGQDIYHRALKNPEYLARITITESMGEVECENMLSVAGEAYHRKTGLGYEKFLALVPNEPYPEIDIDWNDHEDDLEKMFPKLWKKFEEG